MLLGRPGWPAVQTEIVEALTFPGLLSISACRWPGEPACASAWEMWPLRERQLEKPAWGWGRGLWETEGREKGLPTHNGAPWRPLGGQCAPWGPRFSAPARRPGSSCLLRTRPCKCAHLILNPLRRPPCERGKGWPRQSFTNRRSGNPGAWQNVCTTHANGADHLEKQSFCPVVGEQNQLRALKTSMGFRKIFRVFPLEGTSY